MPGEPGIAAPASAAGTSWAGVRSKGWVGRGLGSRALGTGTCCRRTVSAFGRRLPNLPSGSPVLWIVVRLVSVQLLASYTEVPGFDGLYLLVEQAGYLFLWEELLSKEMLSTLDI